MRFVCSYVHDKIGIGSDVAVEIGVGSENVASPVDAAGKRQQVIIAVADEQRIAGRPDIAFSRIAALNVAVSRRSADKIIAVSPKDAVANDGNASLCRMHSVALVVGYRVVDDLRTGRVKVNPRAHIAHHERIVHFHRNFIYIHAVTLQRARRTCAQTVASDRDAVHVHGGIRSVYRQPAAVRISVITAAVTDAVRCRQVVFDDGSVSKMEFDSRFAVKSSAVCISVAVTVIGVVPAVGVSRIV